MTGPDFYYPLTLGLNSRAKGRADASGIEQADSQLRRPSEAVEFKVKHEMVVLRKLLMQAPRGGRLWFVLGEPGSGKSTLCEQWFSRAAKAGAVRLGTVAPILVRLRELRSRDLELNEGAFARRLWINACGARALLPESAARLYSPDAAGTVVPLWLLDGIDELPSEQLTRSFFSKLTNLPGAKAVTCRTAAFEELRRDAAGLVKHELHVLPLEPKRQALFLRRVLPNNPDRADALHWANQHNAQLRYLAGSPLLLRLIAEFCNPNQLPLSRAEFYRTAVEQLWNRKLRTLSRGTYHRVTAARDECLTNLAREMGLDHIEADLKLLVATAEREYPGADPSLEECLENAGLLKVRRVGTGARFSFVHLTFQEYFFARALREQDLLLSLEQLWAEPRYEEALALLLALLHEEGLVETILPVLREFLQRHQDCHANNPNELRNMGRSPLRTVLHIFARSGVRLDTPGTLETLAGGSSILQSAIELDTRLAREQRKDTLRQRKHVPAKTLKRFSADSDAVMLRAIASASDTAPKILAQLAARCDEQVLESLASNPNTPPKTLARLARSGGVRIRVGVAENGSTPPAILTQLAAIDDQRVMMALASNPRTPPEILARFAGIDDQRVMEALASNTGIPPEILAKLAAENNAEIRAKVAGNRRTPPEILGQLAAEKDVRVLNKVASNPRTPPDILAGFAARESLELRFDVARNRSTPPTVLAYLATDTCAEIRESVAENSKTLPETLAELAIDGSQEVREFVAKNAGTSSETLTHLASDRRSVQISALQNPNLLLEDLVIFWDKARADASDELDRDGLPTVSQIWEMIRAKEQSENTTPT